MDYSVEISYRDHTGLPNFTEYFCKTLKEAREQFKLKNSPTWYAYDVLGIRILSNKTTRTLQQQSYVE